MRRILLYGGSFDPIHLGHVAVAHDVADRLAIDQVILIPAGRPPHKPDRRLAPFEDRMAMCRLATAGDPRFSVSDWEAHRAGPTYTVDTVRHYRDLLPDAWLGWLIGMDSLIELPTWRDVGALAELCTLVTAARPGYPPPDLSHVAHLVSPEALERIHAHILPTPEVEVSGSEIRARLRDGLPITGLVNDAVADYILGRGLYGSQAAPHAR